LQVIMIISRCRLQLCSSVSSADRNSNTYEPIPEHMAVDIYSVY
jgi:hypothetical protein